MSTSILTTKLESFLKELEEDLSNARKFRPRYIEISRFIPTNDSDVDKLEENILDETITLRAEPSEYKSLTPGDYKKSQIVSIDTSSLRIGETERGIVAAYRASIVFFDGEGYSITKLGPFIVNISEGNKAYIYNYFRSLLGLEEVDERKVPMLYKVVDRVRNFIERYLQILTAGLIKNGIILWDGSLTSGTVDTPKEILVRALKRAEQSGNSVIGVSKSSYLRTINGHRLIDLLSDVYMPSYIKLNDLIRSETLMRILGDVYAVKFSPHGFTFRVDVHSRDSEEDLKRTYSLCPMFNGYPDPLRQAHVNCYFTANEVLALQSYVIKKYNLEVLPEFDIRKFILYPF
ncbi:MAG: hypothetical protein F7B61_06630 [Caldisphaeraceae archaeon]|nr:hypothetical protein [Caldisphaeraceae archaeon]